MVKCSKCTKVVTKKLPGVQCSNCNKWLHGSCASLTTEQLSALSATDSVAWKCRNCMGSKYKRISCILPGPDEDESDTETLCDKKSSTIDKNKTLSIFREEVREIIRIELQNTLEFYSQKIDDFQEKIKNYELKMKLVENQCNDIKNNYKNVLLQNEILEQRINKIEQAQLCNEIEICGVEEKEDEDVHKIAHSVCQVLKQKPEDIIRAIRKKKPVRLTAAGEPRRPGAAPISVALRENSRDCWLAAAKTTKITEKDVGGRSDGFVSVRESLTPATAFLLWKTKTTLKEKQLCKFVWCKNGTIMVRKHENDRKIYTVRSAGDIDKVAKELQKSGMSVP